MSPELTAALEQLTQAVEASEANRQEVERLTAAIKSVYGRWAGVLGCAPNYQAIDAAIHRLTEQGETP